MLMSTFSSDAGVGTSASAARAPSRPGTGRAELVTDRGRTTIADAVVQKIAGIATREVAGVYDLGTGGTRAIGAVRERITSSRGPNVAQGVSVEVGETQAAVDVDIVCDYGVSIAELAAAVRRNVTEAIERMTGLEVAEVNIAVDDIHLDDDDTDTGTKSSGPRVQ